MKRNNRTVPSKLLLYLLISAILLMGCGTTPTPPPPIEVPANLVFGSSNGKYVNILINSVEFKGKVSNFSDIGNLQLIIVVSDDSGHADALICPYGGVTKIHQGDNINPCKAGLTYPEDILQGNLSVMLIAMDVKDSSTLADIGTNVITSGLSTGLGIAIQGTSEMTPQLAIGLIALSTIVGYAGTKTQEYFQQNYVIGSQSFAMSPEYHWNNGQPISASSTDQQVVFTFMVQQSSTASGQLVDSSAPSNPEPVPTSLPAPTISIPIPTPANVTAQTASISCAQRIYFVKLRRTPGYNNKDETADTVAEIPCGEIVQILGGPTSKDNLSWWQVTWNGQTGWTADHTSTGKVVLIFDK